MTKQNNAARVAVQAKPCPNQAMQLAVQFLTHSLEHLMRVSYLDEAWGTEDGESEVDFAAELALCHVKRLGEKLPCSRDEFERDWYMAAAAINLSVKAFPRKNSHYFRVLEGAEKAFAVLAEAIEFADLEVKV